MIADSIWIILVLIVLNFFPDSKESDYKWEYKKPRETTSYKARMPRIKRLTRTIRSVFSYLYFKIRKVIR